jgi:hypothetical protein
MIAMHGSSTINTDAVSPSPIPTHVLGSSTFQLQISKEAHLGMDAECILAHPVLNYRYVTMTAPSIFYHDRIRRLDQSLDGATLLQMTGMDVRPMEYEPFVKGYGKTLGFRGAFEVPDDWRFHDEVVVRFLDEAWTEVVRKGMESVDVE